MDGVPLPSALRELQRVATSRLFLTMLVIAVIVLTISGPFGTLAGLDPASRLTYWMLISAGCYLTGKGCALLVQTSLRRRIPNYWRRLIVVALIAALPVGLVVLIINALFFGWPAADRAVETLLESMALTMLVTLALGAATCQRQPGNGDLLAAAPPLTAGAPAILDRVPPPKRGRLLALSVDDHYVEVLTERGRTLVLLRLSDAMRETAPVPGLQVHRSHWIARDAVAQVLRSGGKTSIELVDGTRIPVSRGFQADVREAGLG